MSTKTKFIIGLILIPFIAFPVYYVHCSTNMQRFFIYLASGICLIFIAEESAKKTILKLIGSFGKFELFGGTALVVGLIWLDPISKYGLDNCSMKKTITVFVHGEKGPQDIILSSGKVIIDVNGERKDQDIDSKGQAKISNLKLGDTIKLDVKYSEPYKAVKPDSVYTISEQDAIYLKVRLNMDSIVRGHILYRNLGLADVIISIDSLHTTSNTSGYYEIKIPEDLRKIKYTVWFQKKGYRSFSDILYPQTGGTLDEIMNAQ